MNNKEPTDDQLQDSLECCQDGQDAKIIAAAYYREKAGREKTESELKTYIKTSNEKSALISDLRDELKEAAVRAENAENKLKDSVARMEAAERCSARWMGEWDKMKEDRNRAEACLDMLREKVLKIIPFLPQHENLCSPQDYCDGSCHYGDIANLKETLDIMEEK